MQTAESQKASQVNIQSTYEHPQTTRSEEYKKLHAEYQVLVKKYEKEIEFVKHSNREHSKVLDLYEQLNQKHHELLNCVSHHK